MTLHSSQLEPLSNYVVGDLDASEAAKSMDVAGEDPGTTLNGRQKVAFGQPERAPGTSRSSPAYGKKDRFLQ